MKLVEIYTDGACSGNPGPGGWAAIFRYNPDEDNPDVILEISGNSSNTTNNRMELLAVINGLSKLNQPCEVNLYSDSAYVCNAINLGWLEKWKRTGWSRGKRGAVSNRDLWETLDSLLAVHQVHFIKVKGHSDNKYNNRCDELARMAILNIK